MAVIQTLEININPYAIKSIMEFASWDAVYINFKKNTCFYRYIGFDDRKSYLQEIIQMDQRLNDKKAEHNCGYLRVKRLTLQNDLDKTSEYILLYEKWKKISKADYERQKELLLPFHFINDMWEYTFKYALIKVLECYRKITKNSSETMVRNFFVKLMNWIEIYMPELFLERKVMCRFPKLVFCGPVKEQEYLFLYLLSLTGCDILYLNPEQDINFSNPILNTLSSLCLKEKIGKIDLPIYRRESAEVTELIGTKKISENDKPAKTVIPACAPPVLVREPAELEYEELAKLAASVVMIQVFNNKKECFKTGSGVLIRKDGFILTNFHVVSGGAYYGVRLEEEEEIYYTTELVKYHSVNDLALLKIECIRQGIPIYQGDKMLIRGQKVAAIGSPLGLFNSVSNGIIAGFRKFEDVSMIQFTAPTSHGSSGGALLDLYGRLIGIITAGFDDGQNLNLAVDYLTLLPFVQGFLT